MAPEQELPEREQLVAGLLAQARADTRAPASLRDRIEALPRRRSRGRIWAPGLRVALGGGAVLAAAVTLAVISLVGGVATPTLAQVAALARRGPAGPAPGPDTSHPATLLAAGVGGLHFPNWESQGGWRASGERFDTVAGRRVVTVYYMRGGRRLVYSIVASPTLPSSTVANSPYVSLRFGGGATPERVSVVWTDRDHTCVLSGAGISAESLWRLAATTLD